MAALRPDPRKWDPLTCSVWGLGPSPFGEIPKLLKSLIWHFEASYVELQPVLNLVDLGGLVTIDHQITTKDIATLAKNTGSIKHWLLLFFVFFTLQKTLNPDELGASILGSGPRVFLLMAEVKTIKSFLTHRPMLLHESWKSRENSNIHRKQGTIFSLLFFPFSKIWDILNIYSYCGFKLHIRVGEKKVYKYINIYVSLISGRFKQELHRKWLHKLFHSGSLFDKNTHTCGTKCVCVFHFFNPPEASGCSQGRLYMSWLLHLHLQ